MAYTVEMVGDISEQDKGFPMINLLLKNDSFTFKMDTVTQTDKVYMTLENVKMHDHMLVLLSKFATMKNPNTFLLNLSELNVMDVAREMINSMTQMYVDCLYRGVKMSHVKLETPDEETRLPTTE